MHFKNIMNDLNCDKNVIFVIDNLLKKLLKFNLENKIKNVI